MPTTPSKTPFPCSTLAEHARGADASLRAFLRGLCAEPRRHARWLNTLSLLEHIGSRKIMVSQSRAELPDSVLKHLAEETRHASAFRRFAARLAGREMSFAAADALAPASAKMYFGRLDSLVSGQIVPRSPELSYLYVTAVIELRAMWLYRAYDEVLKEEGVPISLSGILAEEDGHLAEMRESLGAKDPFWESRIERFTALECGLYDVFFKALLAAK